MQETLEAERKERLSGDSAAGGIARKPDVKRGASARDASPRKRSLSEVGVSALPARSGGKSPAAISATPDGRCAC